MSAWLTSLTVFSKLTCVKKLNKLIIRKVIYEVLFKESCITDFKRIQSVVKETCSCEH